MHERLELGTRRRRGRLEAKLGVPVLTADSGRPYAPRRVRELARYEVPTPLELEARTTRTARVLTFEAG